MKRYLYIVGLLSLLTSCRNDIEINAEWKETAVVYALLDANEPVHYIRVEKTFMNTNADALRVAGMSDSIYYDTLQVAIRQMSGSSIVQVIDFYPDYNAPKQSGVFASNNAVLYTSTAKLNPKATYQLYIRNPRTGKEYTSITHMVSNSFIQTKTSMFSLNPDQIVGYYFFTGPNAYEYEANITLHYSEYDSASNQLLGRHTINWAAAKGIFPTSPQSSKSMRFDLEGSSFYNQIAGRIPVKYGIWRSMDTCDIILYGAGQELSSYIALNKPSLSIVQKKTDYSNITNGIGIFSSRNTNSDQMGLPISDSTKYYIATSPLTSELRFKKP